MEQQSPKNVKVLDGKNFYYAFLAGAQRIFENQGVINKINVFPVADADTGTNLASTMRSIVDSPIPTDSIKTTAVALADAALVGARGNSGIIFAQFLYGFSKEISVEVEFSIENFAQSIKNAVAYAYESIANPVEGTMITVIREWAEFIYTMKGIINDFVELLSKAYHVAVDSLQATTQKLEALAKANVVDAGAKGFVLFLEGMVDFYKQRTDIRSLKAVANEVYQAEIETMPHEEITFRYCCEALLTLDKGKGENKEKIKNLISPLGDSMVIAGSDKKVRIHIHSDDPIKLFGILADQADITYQKVDDMVMQQQIAHERKWNIGLVTDSTCDLPQELIEKYQISVIPLNIHAGKTQFLDRTTISTDMFYDRLDSFPSYPSTSQPSYKDFINRYAYLSTHYDKTIAINLSKALSGTFSNSTKAAKSIIEQSGKPITVHNSKQVASGVGLLVLRVAKAIEAGMSYEEITSKLDEWTEKNTLLVSTLTVKYLIKSGRLSSGKGFIGKLLGVNPVLSLDKDGKAISKAKPIGERRAMQYIIDEIKEYKKTNKIWGYAISHIRNPESAAWYTEQLTELTGKQPEFVTECSPVLGINGGPGIVALSFMLE